MSSDKSWETKIKKVIVWLWTVPIIALRYFKIILGIIEYKIQTNRVLYCRLSALAWLVGLFMTGNLHPCLSFYICCIDFLHFYLISIQPLQDFSIIFNFVLEIFLPKL